MMTPTEPRRPARVFVFAPALFLTATLERRGQADELHLHAGGQGLWIARMLGVLGTDVVLCGPFGGETGMVARTLVTQEGIAVDAVGVESWSGAYVHDRRDRRPSRRPPGHPGRRPARRGRGHAQRRTPWQGQRRPSSGRAAGVPDRVAPAVHARDLTRHGRLESGRAPVTSAIP